MAAMETPSNFEPNPWHQLVRLDWASDRLHLHYADMAPVGSDRWLPVQRKQPPPNDLLYSRIGGLARVPATGLIRLQKCISLELEREWRWYERPIIDQQVLRSAHDEVETWKGLLSELQATLSRPFSCALATLIWAAANIYEAERAPTAAELLHPEKPARTVGRPARGGFGKHIGPGCLKQFTFRLLWDISSVGGRLTLDKNGGTGSLKDVLERLSPHLPPGFIPNALPLSTLATIHARAKKIADDDPLDKKLAVVDVDKPNSGPEKSTHL
jgi:hypothetical protein